MRDATRAWMRWGALLLWVAFALSPAAALGADPEEDWRPGRPITLVVRDAAVNEVFEMLSREGRVNIVLSKGVEGEVSVNLFEETIDRSVRAVAEAAGYAAERRGGGYLIVQRDQAGKDHAQGHTMIRTFQVHYSDPEIVSQILEKHLSRYGELTVMKERNLIVVEDLPDFVDRIDRLLVEIDDEPQQILIEARILEIKLEDDDAYGIDWSRSFDALSGVAAVAQQGFATPGLGGLVLGVAGEDTQVLLTALQEEGSVRTLTTQTLLALEHEEAEVVIGDRLGFRVVTTVNEVTSESVEFLESGVILRIRAAVDRHGRIRLDVHPEVSIGVIEDGLPSQTTTEVTTSLLADDGQPVFIGGLMKDQSTREVRGIPYLKDIPVLGWLFRGHDKFDSRTETVVLLTSHVMDAGKRRLVEQKTRWVPGIDMQLEEKRRHLEQEFELEPGGAVEEVPLPGVESDGARVAGSDPPAPDLGVEGLEVPAAPAEIPAAPATDL